MSDTNVFTIVETAVVRRSSTETYHIVAKTVDGSLYEMEKQPKTMDSAIMWADMLMGTTLHLKEWAILLVVL